MAGFKPEIKQIKHAPVAQLDRVSGYEPGGREFESLRARKIIKTRISGFFPSLNNSLEQCVGRD